MGCTRSALETSLISHFLLFSRVWGAQHVHRLEDQGKGIDTTSTSITTIIIKPTSLQQINKSFKLELFAID